MPPKSTAEHTPAYIDTAEGVREFVRAIAPAKVLALDTEGASFHRFVDRIYLLQLSTRELTAVIDPLPIGTPTELGELLERRDVEVVFHDADYDLRLLERYFGVRLDKKHQRADWSMRPLTKDMLAYAAQDTMHLIPLRDRLREELERKGRWSWAEEEFRRLEGTRWEPEDTAQAFMRLKGARDLSRRELAVLRELVQWRDAPARAQDKSTFRVIGNEALLEAARVRPRTLEQLAAIKGMPRGILERSG